MKIKNAFLAFALILSSLLVAPQAVEAFPTLKKIRHKVVRVVSLPIWMTVGLVVGAGSGVVGGVYVWQALGDQDKQLEAARANAAKVLQDLKNHVPTAEEAKKSEELDRLQKEGEKMLKEIEEKYPGTIPVPTTEEIPLK